MGRAKPDSWEVRQVTAIDFIVHSGGSKQEVDCWLCSFLTLGAGTGLVTISSSFKRRLLDILAGCEMISDFTEYGKNEGIDRDAAVP